LKGLMIASIFFICWANSARRRRRHHEMRPVRGHGSSFHAKYFHSLGGGNRTRSADSDGDLVKNCAIFCLKKNQER